MIITKGSEILRRVRRIVEGEPTFVVVPDQIDSHATLYMRAEYKKSAQHLIEKHESVELAVRWLNVEIAKACFHESGAAYS